MIDVEAKIKELEPRLMEICRERNLDANERELIITVFKASLHIAFGVLLTSLWHDASEELPEKGENCIIRVSCEYEDHPEDNYEEYNTAVFLGGSSWSEDHFDSEADVYVLRWCRISDLLPTKGGEE